MLFKHLPTLTIGILLSMSANAADISASEDDSIKLSDITATAVKGWLATKDKAIEIYNDQKLVAQKASAEYKAEKCEKEPSTCDSSVTTQPVQDTEESNLTGSITKGWLKFKDKASANYKEQKHIVIVK